MARYQLLNNNNNKKNLVQLGWLILVESEFLCSCFDILL